MDVVDSHLRDTLVLIFKYQDDLKEWKEKQKRDYFYLLFWLIKKEKFGYQFLNEINHLYEKFRDLNYIKKTLIEHWSK